MNLKFLFGFLLLVASSTGLPAEENSKLHAMVKNSVDSDFNRLADLYRDLHAHPELSFEEEKTAERIAGLLKSSGFEVTTKIGGHGLVGLLKNGTGPVIMVRTDLDALPVKEHTSLPYASKARQQNERGIEVDVMHACGHDMHMTVFCGAARFLALHTNLWSGTLVFIGQPAEEKGEGARRMLADGLFTRFPKPDYALALHVSPTLEAGKIGFVEGYSFANVNSVDVTIRGVGGHGAYPHKTKDPVVLAAQAILAFQTIVSRELEPKEPAVLTVGSIHGGTKHNIIPDEVRLQLTLRSYSDEVREHLLASIRRICRGLAEAAGLPPELYPTVEVKEATLSLYNNPELTQKLADSLKNWLGKEKVVPESPVMAGEDFAHFGRTAEKIPVCLLWLGSVSPEKKGELPSLHSSNFAPVPEKTIQTGVTTIVASVLELAPNKIAPRR